MPDGIEQGRFGMKNMLLLLAMFSTITLLNSCSKDSINEHEVEGVGYTYYAGKYSDGSECYSACSYYGYRASKFYYGTGNCYCK